MTTVSDLLTSALRKGGIITMEETPSAAMLNNTLTAMNNMLESWSNDGVNVFARTWLNFNLTGGQSTYQIGVGATDFNTTRPSAIISAYVRLGNIDYPVLPIGDSVYADQIAAKSISGIPKWFNYDNGFPLANIRLWPIPASAYTLYIQNENPLTDFVLTDTVTLPPGWNRAIIFNLANEICGDYGQEPPQSSMQIAAKAFDLIRKQVLKQRSLDKYPQGISSNNIYAGWFS
jgi:hypothetical protein